MDAATTLKNTEDTVKLVQDCITWLDENSKSTNMVAICVTIDRLAVLSCTIGHQQSLAYAVMNELEDEYDIAFAEAFARYTKETSAAASKYLVEAELKQPRRDFTKAKNDYKRLSIYMDRIDKVIESYRQLVSTYKMELKNN